jgi:Na+-transporting NADH:ubiquinone oxidoreductase subunit D
MADDLRRVLIDPLVEINPITVQVLGVCSALAVTTQLRPALVMCAALTAVTAGSNLAVSLIRRLISAEIRIIVELTIIASLVIVADQVLKAFSYELSRQLSVFVGLIITNCIVMGRTEGYALRHGPVASFVDGLANGLGYSLVLIAVATCRELLGTGRLLGRPVLPLVGEGGWYQPNGMCAIAAGALLILGLLVWAVRTWRPAQREDA